MKLTLIYCKTFVPMSSYKLIGCCLFLLLIAGSRSAWSVTTLTFANGSSLTFDSVERDGAKVKCKSAVGTMEYNADTLTPAERAKYFPEIQPTPGTATLPTTMVTNATAAVSINTAVVTPAPMNSPTANPSASAVASGTLLPAQTNQAPSSITNNTDKDTNAIARWMAPFWKGNTMHEESLFLWGNPEEEASAPLLFDALEILSVQDSSLTTQYQQGTDWRYEGGKLVRPNGSRMPWTSITEMYPENAGPKGTTMAKKGGGFFLFHEGPFIHNKQVVVTYRHASGVWGGPIPTYDPSALPKTLKKLQARSPLKIVAYGDSITVGANASGFMKCEPYMPTWTELFRQSLENAYGTQVEMVNKAVGGKGCVWGVENAATAFKDQHPDLVLIGFGMNDLAMPADQFDVNIRKIMEAARVENPDVEFILIQSMERNPQSLGGVGNIAAFGEKLKALKSPGVALVDIMSLHAELLRKKRYEDMTGNMINHPNDFLARVYAQAVSATLVNPDAKP